MTLNAVLLFNSTGPEPVAPECLLENLRFSNNRKTTANDAVLQP
jgi:hypothetical protein